MRRKWLAGLVSACLVAVLTTLPLVSCCSDPVVVEPDEGELTALAASSLTNRGATISWTSSKAGSTQVEYGKTASYGTETTAVATAVTSHEVALTGLEPATLYYYNVMTTVPAAGEVEAEDLSKTGTFTTAAKVTYNLGIIHMPTSDSPYAMGIGEADGSHIGSMYEPLFWSLNDGTELPGLATSLTINAGPYTAENPVVWTCTLNSAAKWADGTAVTSDDVIFTYQNMMANQVGQTDDLDLILTQADGATDDAAVLTLVDGGTAADTITRAAGDFVADGYQAGERLTISGSAADDGVYKIAAVAALTITLNAEETLTGEAASAAIDIASSGSSIDAITKVSDTVFTFELNSYKATFIRDITDAVITPKAVWSDLPTGENVMTYLNPDPMGSGPFTLVSRTTDESVVYAARLDYWGGAPNIDTFIKHYFGEEQVQMLALLNGDIDAALQLNMPTAVPTLLSDPDVKIYQADTNSTYSWYLNHHIEPFEVLAVRKAMSIGIDRAAMVNFAADGWAIMPSLTEVSPLLAHWNEDTLWAYADSTYDERIDLANAALDAITGMSATPARVSGDLPAYQRTYDNGTDPAFDLEYSCLTTTSPQHTSIFELLQADCAEMGITLNHDPQEAKALVGTVFRQKTATWDDTKDDWDTAVWGRPFGPLYDYVADQWGEYDPPVLSKRGSIMGWVPANAVQDQFAELVTLEIGSTARDALIQSSQQLWADEEPSIALFHSVTPHAHRIDRFTGWVEDAGAQVQGSMGAMGAMYNILSLVPIYD